MHLICLEMGFSAEFCVPEGVHRAQDHGMLSYGGKRGHMNTQIPWAALIPPHLSAEFIQLWGDRFSMYSFIYYFNI